MKSISIASMAVAAMLLATSCKKVQPVIVVEMGTVPLGVEGHVNKNALPPPVVANQAASRVSDAAGFEQDDQISFYAVKYNGSTPSPLGQDANTYINNEVYSRTGDLFRSWDGAAFRERYFPNDGSAIDIYGIYPRMAANPADFEAYEFAVKADQTDIVDYYASDLLMGKSPKIEPTAVPCKLIFNHLMARVVINIKLTGFENGTSVSQIKMLNTSTKATVNLRAYNTATGVAGSTVSVSTPLDITPNKLSTAVSGFDNTYVAVIPTQLFASGSDLIGITTSTANKDKYTLKVGSSQLALQSGSEHIFNITVEFGGRPNLTLGNATIAPWGTTTANLDGQKKSECKFVVNLTTMGAADMTETAWVKVGVNDNMTFTLPATYVDTPNRIMFEFRGDGNRPNQYPFDISSLEVLQSDMTTLVDKIAVSGLQIVAGDRSETTPVTLAYDIQNQTLTR